jgi:hypothetical protein
MYEKSTRVSVAPAQGAEAPFASLVRDVADAEAFVRGVVKDVVDAEMHAGANLSTPPIQIAVGRVTLVLIARCRRRDAEIRLHTIKEVRLRFRRPPVRDTAQYELELL